MGSCIYPVADAGESDSTRVSVAASTYDGFGMLQKDSQKPKEAQESLREALACHEAVVRADPDSAEFQHGLANTHNIFGTLWRTQNDQQAAEKEFRQARDIWDRLNRAHPGVFECQNRLVWTNYNLGLVYKDTDRLEQAERAFRDTLQALTDLAQSYPNVTIIPITRGRTLSNPAQVVPAAPGTTGRPLHAEQLLPH